MTDSVLSSKPSYSLPKVFFDSPVSSEFRNLLLSTFNLTYPPDLALVSYLLHTSFLDEWTNWPVVDRVTLARLAGTEHLVSQGRFRAGEMLSSFSPRTGLQLKISSPISDAGVARTALPLLTPELTVLLERDLVSPRREVRLLSGQPYSRRALLKETKAGNILREQAWLSSARPNYDVARYLNTLPSIGFREFSARLPVARAYVLQHMQGDTLRHQLRILNLLTEYFPPTYQQVPNSERLFTVGDSAVYLASEVRDLLLASCWKPDLSNAHLVIAARLWGLEALLERLERDGSVWPSLIHELQLSPGQKPDLKKVIYSTVYGMSVSGLKRAISRVLGKSVTERYFALPMTTQLLEARESHMAAIADRGGVLDAFGSFHSLGSTGKDELEAQIRTLLSREVGSYEFKVMSAALKPLQDSGKEPQARVVLWVHDGLYVKFRDSNRAYIWGKYIQEAVEAEARKLGMNLRFIDENMALDDYNRHHAIHKKTQIL